jgi:hypothetical protein
MKKLVVGVLLLALAAAVFADDALVLPKGVLRTYFTGAYAFFSEEWDGTGEKVATTGYDMLSAINLGGAIEFGVIDWISAAVQWAPGWNVWSATKNGSLIAPFGFDGANLLANGPYNIFAGAKIQIVGPNAPVANETIRLAAAAGVKIPVNAPDAAYWADQFTAATGTDQWVGAYNDKPLWGLGARAYFDYVLNKMFYFNLYSEFIYYLGTVKREALSLADWAAVNPGPAPNSDVALGYDLTFEAEPHFETMFGNGMRLGVGLPVTFSMSPEIKYDGGPDPIDPTGDTASYALSVSPNVSLFLTKFIIPTEIKVGYTLPLVGKNAYATNTVVVQLKTYLRFYK